jgi:hypothetical protein
MRNYDEIRFIRKQTTEEKKNKKHEQEIIT